MKWEGAAPGGNSRSQRDLAPDDRIRSSTVRDAPKEPPMGFGSITHWIVIGIVALLLFGSRLPELARSIGRAINEFKKGIREVNEEDDEAAEPEKPRSRLNPPTDRNVEAGSDQTHSEEAENQGEERVARPRVKETTPSDS